MSTQICKTCRFEGYRCAPSSDGTCGAYEKKIMTNFERIKAMSIEELAKELAKDSACEFCKTLDEQTCDKITCEQGIIQWLESEVVE